MPGNASANSVEQRRPSAWRRPPSGRPAGRPRSRPRAGAGRPRRSRGGRPRGAGSGRAARRAAAGAGPAADRRSARPTIARAMAGRSGPGWTSAASRLSRASVSPRNGIRSMCDRVWHVARPTVTPRSRGGSGRIEVAGRPTAIGSGRRVAATCSIARRRSSRPAGSNSYVQRRTRSGRSNRWSRPLAIASRDMRITSAVRSISVELALVVHRGREQLDAGRARQRQRLGDVLGAAVRGADQRRPASPAQRRDLVDELHDSPGPTSIATTGTRPWTSACASSAWNVVVATRS